MQDASVFRKTNLQGKIPYTLFNFLYNETLFIKKICYSFATLFFIFLDRNTTINILINC